MTLRTERIRTFEQVRTFVEGSEPGDFKLVDRDATYAFVSRTLARFRYHGLGRADKDLVNRFLEKVTGFSRAQITRLIQQHRRSGHIRDHGNKPPAKPFSRRDTPRDVALLAEAGPAFG